MTAPAAPGQNGNMLRVSSIQKTSSWPSLLCATLVECRNGNMPFADAWKVAIRVNPKPANEEWTGWDAKGKGPKPIEELTLNFMRRHFEAAYERRPGRLGRIRVEPPTKGPEGLSEPHTASQDGSDATVPMPWCRSSAVCPERAISATPGHRFCQEHTDEMARVQLAPEPPAEWWMNADEKVERGMPLLRSAA